jgi:polysaccharide biosynthesis/export protein
MSRCRTSCVSSARVFVGKTIDLLAPSLAQGILRGIGAFRISKSRFIKRGLVTVALLCSVVPAAAAEYQVDVGDVIEILVARVPELQRRVPVKSDGSISFPLLGTLVVAGLSPSEVEANIQAALATKIFRQRTSDGRENAVAIEPDEVTAVVVQHRPIYVNGDVSKPGEQAFRPLMTVRQAIALSGGYDILRLRMENPILLSADLRGEYESLWTEFAKERARASRLNIELGEKDTLDQKLLADVPLSPSRKAEIVSVEAEYLRTEQADYEREKAFLQHSITQGDEQIKVLSEQNAKEEQGVQADAEELQRINELFGKGALVSPRVTDARRAVLLSSTRKLQTAAQLMQVKKQQDDIARQLERLDDQRRIKWLQDLQEARTKIGQIRARLQSVGEKLLYTAARSQVMRGNEFKQELTVIRKGKSGPERIIVDQDSELRPGDVVEVALRLDEMAGKNKLAQTAGFAAQTELAAAAASAGNAAQGREATANAPAGNATVTATGRAENAPDPAPNAATASLEAARTSNAPAETAAGLIVDLPQTTDHEPVRTTAAATIAGAQALTAAAPASVPLPRRGPRATLRQRPRPTLALMPATERRSISLDRSPAP